MNRPEKTHRPVRVALAHLFATGAHRPGTTHGLLHLGLRYLILKNDGFQCVTCGNGPAEGAKLHVDHKVPFSLGGLTVMSNLRTLYANCNLGRGNHFTD